MMKIIARSAGASFTITLCACAALQSNPQSSSDTVMWQNILIESETCATDIPVCKSSGLYHNLLVDWVNFTKMHPNNWQNKYEVQRVQKAFAKIYNIKS